MGQDETNGNRVGDDDIPTLPTIHVISDSIGVTARSIARAAASQFGVTGPSIETLALVKDFEEVEAYLEEHCRLHEENLGSNKIILFYTIVDREIHHHLSDYLEYHPNIVGVDLITDAIRAIAQVSGRAPHIKPGYMHQVDENYFRRIEAMEFTIAHDDGRNPHDLKKADIVLLGVSRSSKTPTSVYLSQQGYKVANVPLDLHTEPPKEIFEVDKTRLFGLVTTSEVLVDIRRRRLGNAIAIAPDYADPEQVEQDLEKARALMRQLGAIVVHTDNRAVEETAQEILRYYEMVHPPKA